MGIALRFVGSQHWVPGGAAPRGAAMQQLALLIIPVIHPRISLHGSSPDWELEAQERALHLCKYCVSCRFWV